MLDRIGLQQCHCWVRVYGRVDTASSSLWKVVNLGCDPYFLLQTTRDSRSHVVKQHMFLRHTFKESFQISPTVPTCRWHFQNRIGQRGCTKSKGSILIQHLESTESARIADFQSLTVDTDSTRHREHIDTERKAPYTTPLALITPSEGRARVQDGERTARVVGGRG